MPRGSGLELRVSRSTHTVLVEIIGEVDVANASILERGIEQVVGGVVTGDALVVDLSELKFISSIGLRVLLASAHDCERRNVPMRLVGAGENIRRVLALSGVDQVVQVGEDGSTGGAAHRGAADDEPE